MAVMYKRIPTIGTPQKGPRIYRSSHERPTKVQIVLNLQLVSQQSDKGHDSLLELMETVETLRGIIREASDPVYGLGTCVVPGAPQIHKSLSGGCCLHGLGTSQLVMSL